MLSGRLGVAGPRQVRRPVLAYGLVAVACITAIAATLAFHAISCEGFVAQGVPERRRAPGSAVGAQADAKATQVLEPPPSIEGEQADAARTQVPAALEDPATSEPGGPGASSVAAAVDASDAGLPVAAGAGAVVAVLFAVVGPLLAQAGPVVAAREGLVGLLKPLLDAYPIPLVMGLPPALLHWSHAGNTLAVLLVVGGIGVSEGFAVRRRRSEGKAPRPNVHSAAMTVVVLYTLGASVGAFASMRYDKQPILESPHGWTSLLVLALLLANASTGYLGTLGSAAPQRLAAGDGRTVASDSAEAAREAHAKVGVAALAAVAVSAILGTALGFSFGPADQPAAEYNSMGNLGLDYGLGYGADLEQRED